MKKVIVFLGILALVLSTGGVSKVMAGNVTIADTLGNSTFAPNPASGKGFEDQETESGTLSSQTPGDIFIANQTAAPSYGGTSPAFTGSNVYGYNYAVTMNFGAGTYNLYQIDGTTAVKRSGFVTPGSDPWVLGADGKQTLVPGQVGWNYTGTLQYVTGINDATSGFSSDLAGQSTHNEVILLGIGAFLPDYAANDQNYGAYLHYTYECGNDLLMGHIVGSPVRVPPSALLLGTGLLGLVGLRWRRRQTNG
jgi:hypothetical protein